MSDWRSILRQGGVICRTWHGDAPVRQFVPTEVDQLWTPVVVRDLGEIAKGDFTFAYRQFVESGETVACHECEAGKTIEKFGQAIQFKETFMIEFERIPALRGT